MDSNATAISSGDVSGGSQVITSIRTILHAVMVNGAGEVKIYDGTDTSGDLLAVCSVSGADRSREFVFCRPVRAWNGIYVEVVSAPDNAIIHYG